MLVQAERRRLVFDASAPIARTHALPRAHDSKLEARLDRDLRRLGSPWTILREPAVIHAGRRRFYLDFALVRAGERVLVEVAGFWTPEYLAQKVALLDAISAPFVLCVDARHAPEELRQDPRVLAFRRAIDAPALLALCERMLAARHERERKTHFVVIPESRWLRERAVRAGARVETWREDVFRDLFHDGAPRVARLPAHPVYGPQLHIAGRAFSARANADHSRRDAIFVHRIERPGAAAGEPQPVATWRLLAPGSHSTDRGDAITTLFEGGRR